MQGSLIVFISILYFSYSLAPAHHLEEKCFDENKPIGTYLGFNYQIVNIKEGHILEMSCKKCNENQTIDTNAIWATLGLKPASKKPILKKLKTMSNKFKKAMEIKALNTLVIRNVAIYNSGMYICLLEGTGETDNHIAYYLNTLPKDLRDVSKGTLKDRIHYEQDIISPINLMLKNDILNVSLDIDWSSWSPCLCGSQKFSSKNYRYGYPFIKVNELEEELIIPIKSKFLKKFYPHLTNYLQNLSIFEEYKRCVDDCIPDAIAEDIDFKYMEVAYCQEGSDRKFECPESENTTDILWTFREKLINKTDHALGTEKLEVHIAVDLNNILYLNRIQEKESGVYSCFVDGFAMKTITVIFIPSSRIFNDEFNDGFTRLTTYILFCFVLWIFILFIKISNIYLGFEVKE